MKHPTVFSVFAILAAILVCTGISRAQVPTTAPYPTPSPYPISWELKFDYSLPQRIVVEVPGTAAPQVYWYLLYTVTNNTDKEQMFLPVFELMTKDGRIIRSDKNIPQAVFDLIKQREKKPFLQPFPSSEAQLRLGEDQARDCVAIWPEPDTRMGQFSIFVSGLSGETALLKDSTGAALKDSSGEPIILRKTLQLNFIVRGDQVRPAADAISELPKQWVMR